MPKHSLNYKRPTRPSLSLLLIPLQPAILRVTPALQQSQTQISTYGLSGICHFCLISGRAGRAAAGSARSLERAPWGACASQVCGRVLCCRWAVSPGTGLQCTLGLQVLAPGAPPEALRPPPATHPPPLSVVPGDSWARLSWLPILRVHGAGPVCSARSGAPVQSLV